MKKMVGFMIDSQQWEEKMCCSNTARPWTWEYHETWDWNCKKSRGRLLFNIIRHAICTSSTIVAQPPLASAACMSRQNLQRMQPTYMLCLHQRCTRLIIYLVLKLGGRVDSFFFAFYAASSSVFPFFFLFIFFRFFSWLCRDKPITPASEVFQLLDSYK